jgi:DNA-directed RNA polymerase alpha subunit
MSTNFLSSSDDGDPLDLEIEALEFRVQTHNRLKDADIQTLRDIVRLTEEKLIHAGLTAKMIDEIKETLTTIGLRLGM